MSTAYFSRRLKKSCFFIVFFRWSEESFITSFVAFPGILKWQHRLWLTMRSFLNIRFNLENMVSETVVDTPVFKENEVQLFDSRNYYLKGVTFNYTTAFQLSVAISKMQGLTNSLRVSSLKSVK